MAAITASLLLTAGCHGPTESTTSVDGNDVKLTAYVYRNFMPDDDTALRLVATLHSNSTKKYLATFGSVYYQNSVWSTQLTPNGESGTSLGSEGPMWPVGAVVSVEVAFNDEQGGLHHLRQGNITIARTD